MNLVQLFGLSLLFCLAVMAALSLRFAIPQAAGLPLLLLLAGLQAFSVVAKDAALRRRAARRAALPSRRARSSRSGAPSRVKPRHWAAHPSRSTRSVSRA